MQITVAGPQKNISSIYVGAGIKNPSLESDQNTKLDPFSLRTKYADNKEIIKALDILEEAVKVSNEIKRPIVLYRQILAPLSRAYSRMIWDSPHYGTTDGQINLEKLIQKLGSEIQYPLINADFCEADLQNVNLLGSFCNNANFREANLEGVSFDRASLRGAQFYKAKMAGANLRDSNLCKTNFNGAELQGVDLTGAIMHNASLKGAHLEGAYLYHDASGKLTGQRLKEHLIKEYKVRVDNETVFTIGVSS